LHSYTLSQRYLLRDSKVSLIEIAPPWVRTELMNSSEEERAMPLDEFVACAIEQLGAEAKEILVARCRCPPATTCAHRIARVAAGGQIRSLNRSPVERLAPVKSIFIDGDLQL